MKFMKKTAALLAIAMIAGCAAKPEASAPASASGVSGEFSGTAKGFGGDVTVTLTLENSELVNVVITGEKETPNVGGAAMADIAEKMIANKTVKIDGMTGATFTSDAIAAAVDAALAEAGLTRDAFAEVAKGEVQTIEETCDLVIIGAGGAGLTLANSALENGVANVVILEKMAYVGGATSNAGGIDAGCSKLQEELGMDKDDPEVILSDILRSGTGHNETLSRIMAENQGATLDWLRETEKAPFNDRYGSDFPEHTHQRFFVCEGGMKNCMEILAKNFEEKGGKLMLNTKAEKIVQDETGAVVGVEAVDTDGNTVKVTADAVVVATGGYGANGDMISEKKSDLSYAVFYGVQSSYGDGHKMGQELGAKMLNMGYAKMYPNGITIPGTANGKATPMPTLTCVNTTGAIFVNQDGNRFVNETLAFADIKNATCQQPEEIMYLLMDETGWAGWSEAVATNSSAAGRIEMEEMESYFGSNEAPMFAKGTLDEIAAKAGIDAETLKATVENWNKTVDAGSDEFGRNNLTKIDTEGTYYMVEQKLRFATTLGGFDITGNYEVQKEDGTLIPNLYAVGECVGGPNGTEAIPGSMACWAVVSGRMLGIQLGETLAK